MSTLQPLQIREHSHDTAWTNRPIRRLSGVIHGQGHALEFARISSHPRLPDQVRMYDVMDGGYCHLGVQSLSSISHGVFKKGPDGKLLSFRERARNQATTVFL